MCAFSLLRCFKLTFFTVFVLILFMTLIVFAQNMSENIIFQADKFSSVKAAKADGWIQYSPRDEIRPDFFIAKTPNLRGDGSLGISGASNSASYGCWYKLIKGIKPGNYYKFEASYDQRQL